MRPNLAVYHHTPVENCIHHRVAHTLRVRRRSVLAGAAGSTAQGRFQSNFFKKQHLIKQQPAQLRSYEERGLDEAFFMNCSNN